MYEVTVGNIGRVHEGDNALEAQEVYEIYLLRSLRNQGRGGQEDVVLWHNGEPAEEHDASMPRAEDVLKVLPQKEWALERDNKLCLPCGIQLRWETEEDGRWCTYHAVAPGVPAVFGSDPETALKFLQESLRRAAQRLTDLAGAL